MFLRQINGSKVSFFCHEDFQNIYRQYTVYRLNENALFNLFSAINTELNRKLLFASVKKNYCSKEIMFINKRNCKLQNWHLLLCICISLNRALI